MKERIFLCLLLATVSLLCSCSEQRYVPDSISSHAEITAKPRTTQPEKSTTLPGPEPQEKELTMIVNGMALDVSWEDNETVEELLVYAQNGTITVNTTIYGGFEQVGSLPQSFSRNDVQMTTEPNQGVVAVVPAFLKWQGLCKKKLDTRSDTHCVKIGVQLWWR